MQECREAAEGLQGLLQQGVFVDALAAPADAVAELQGMMDSIVELQVTFAPQLDQGHCVVSQPLSLVCSNEASELTAQNLQGCTTARSAREVV